MMKSSMSKIETNDVMVGPVVSEGGAEPVHAVARP